MEKTTITFSANEQKLQKTGGIDCYASNTVAYIEAHFDLGENWDGYDSVRAVWWNDYNKTVATVLDSDGTCVVPYEVLTRKSAVKVNLVGSIADGDVLTDRLTTCPVVALTIKCNAKTDGDNAQPITPSQFEQFVAEVKTDADRAEAGATESEQSAQSASESATASANSATSSAQSATASAESAQNASESAQSAETAKDDAESARDEILGMRATAETLEAGSDATASYSDGLLTLGIPRGDQGIQGIQGETGATPNLTIGTVETLAPTEDATATITGTAENPVLNLGLPKGDTGEVSLEDLEALLPTDTASGDIASITDGQNIVPVKSLKVTLEPIQSGSGTPSPTNVRPISGRTEVVTWDDPKYGGTVAWNQLLDISTMGAFIASTKSYDSDTGVVTVTPTNYASNSIGFYTTAAQLRTKANHVYFTSVDINPNYSGLFRFGVEGSAKSERLNAGSYQTLATIAKRNGEYAVVLYLASQDWTTGVYKYKNGKVIDLTAMFGSTIADYIYSLEQATAGAGVAYFRNLFPNDYYEYNTGETTCVSAVNGDPYNHYTTTLGRTVYGGTLDVVSGELTVDRAMVDLGSLNWIRITNAHKTYFQTVAEVSDMKKSTGNLNIQPILCSNYEAESWAHALDSDAYDGVVCEGWANKSYIAIADSTKENLDASAFKTAMSGAQLVYELANPQTIQLTPQEVKLLLGDNNVWSDGDVTLVYNADIQKWVEKKLS